MRLLTAALAVAALLASSMVSAEIETWKGFSWDDQPIPGYTAANTLVDTGTDQLWSVLSAVTKTTFIPGSPGEKAAAAKLLYSGTLTDVYARVYDPVYNTNSGWVIYMKDDLGQWLGLGRCTWDSTGYVTLREYDGTSWTKTLIVPRGTTGTNYFANYLSQQLDGTVKVTVDYYTPPSSGVVTSTSNLTYGNFTELYLWASTSSTDYNTFKWTDFVIPEPSTAVALVCGLPLIGFAIRRRR